MMSRNLGLVFVLLALNVVVPALSQTFGLDNTIADDDTNAYGEDPFHESSSEEMQLETFNRPEGTVSLETPVFASPGITSGKYGSYRKQSSWRQAVNNDVVRHQMIHAGTNIQGKQAARAHPWVFRNMHVPSLVGFGFNGFWNSYAPTLPSGLQMMVNNRRSR